MDPLLFGIAMQEVTREMREEWDESEQALPRPRPSVVRAITAIVRYIRRRSTPFVLEPDGRTMLASRANGDHQRRSRERQTELAGCEGESIRC